MRSCERSRFMVGLGDVEEYLAATHGRDQCREQLLGARSIVGNKRPDLEAYAARADHAPRTDLAFYDERAADMSARADPRGRKAGRATGNTVASSAASAANGMAVRGSVFAALAALNLPP